MNRVRILASASTAVVMAGFACFLSNGPSALETISTEMLSRSVGVALLGIVLVAAGLVFRSAVRAEEKPAARGLQLQASEYRRGFRDGTMRAKAPQSTRGGTIASWRHASGEPSAARAFVEKAPALPAAEIERLQGMLRNRTAQIVGRNAKVAQRRGTRSDVDQHGLASR